MSTRPDARDAGLHAVARVRAVRTQDSRIGLQQANHELRQARARLAHLEDGLACSSPTGDGNAFLAARTALVALGGRVAAARVDVDRAGTVADAALDRWRADRSRERAVELLLERRAARRRAERDRAEARVLDDLATQAWQRQRVGPR